MAGDWPSQQRELYGIHTRFPIESVKDTTNRLQIYGLFRYTRYNHENIIHKHVHGDSQQDDAEKLTQNKDQIITQELVDAVQLADDDVIQQDVEQQGDDDVDDGIVGTQ